MTVLFGCASLGSSPEEVAATPPKLTPLDYVRDVAQNCNRIHFLHGTGESPVDCEYQYPQFMGMSFPSAHYHDQNLDIVREFYQKWCGSVLNVTGKAPQFVRTFRRESKTQSLACPETTQKGS